MSWKTDIIKSVLPILAEQIGQGVREYLDHRRENYCEHGIYQGKLCIVCSKCGCKEKEEVEEDE